MLGLRARRPRAARNSRSRGPACPLAAASEASAGAAPSPTAAAAAVTPTAPPKARRDSLFSYEDTGTPRHGPPAAPGGRGTARGTAEQGGAERK